MRMIRPGDTSSSAGLWLVPEQGLLLQRWEGCWRIAPTAWLTRRQHYWGRSGQGAGEPDGAEFMQGRRRWLARHGLDVAEFPRRRDAVRALDYALTRDPLPRIR